MSQKDVRADLIEPIVWNWLADQLQPEALKDGINALQGNASDQRKRIQEQVTVLTRRLGEIDKERRRAVAAYQAEAISLDERKQNKEMSDEALRSINAELARLQDRLNVSGPSDEERTRFAACWIRPA